MEIGNDMTLTDLYPEWLDYKSQLTNSPNTIAVHEKHWNKYFKDTSLFLKPISTITLKDLNLWANALIKNGIYHQNNGRLLKLYQNRFSNMRI